MAKNSALRKADAVKPFDSDTWTDEERFYFEYIDEKLGCERECRHQKRQTDSRRVPD